MNSITGDPNDESEVLHDQMEKIETRQDFAAFVAALRDDRRTRPQGWENPDLESYFDALAALTEVLDQRARNTGRPLPEQPTWKLVGDILLSARDYE